MNIADLLRGGLGGLGRGIQAVGNGLGRGAQFIGDRAFPIDPTAGIDPQTQMALKRQAIMNLGLGMMGGQPISEAMQGAQGTLSGAMQNAYRNSLLKHQQTRQDQREDRELQNDQWMREHTLERDKTADERWKSEQEATRSWRETQAKIDREQMQTQRDVAGMRVQGGLGSPPAGYRWKGDGSGLEFIPGGPADPAVANQTKTGKLTEQEQKAVSQVTRMNGAEQTLKSLNYAPQGMVGAMEAGAAAVPGIGNMLTSNKYQSYQQAAREWIAGLLRFDSGANVPETEFARYFNTYFPQPGDNETVIFQKEVARLRATESISGGLSPVARGKIPTPGATGSWEIEEVG